MSRLGVPALVTATALVHSTTTGPDGRPARDGYGNVVRSATRVTVEGCSWQQPTSSEIVTADRDQVTDGGTLIAPWWPDVPDAALGEVELDGRRWSIEGSPRRHRHPRIGHVTLTLREVTG